MSFPLSEAWQNGPKVSKHLIGSASHMVVYGCYMSAVFCFTVEQIFKLTCVVS